MSDKGIEINKPTFFNLCNITIIFLSIIVILTTSLYISTLIKSNTNTNATNTADPKNMIGTWVFQNLDGAKNSITITNIDNDTIKIAPNVSTDVFSLTRVTNSNFLQYKTTQKFPQGNGYVLTTLKIVYIIIDNIERLILTQEELGTNNIYGVVLCRSTDNSSSGSSGTSKVLRRFFL